MADRSSANSLDFSSVVQAWDRAKESHIHPLWDKSQESYWESGCFQAGQVGQWAEPGATVVDFGCGNGRLSIPLAQAGYDVIAVDSSATMLQRLKERSRQAGVNIKALQSDGSDLAAQLGRKKKADAIVARAVLIHHDFEGVQHIVTNVAKALKKDGHFIADWPLGQPTERDTWISVTTWDAEHRAEIAQKAGLSPVQVSTDPSVWIKK